MCQKVQCPKCHKATWKGCGQHIESALAGVPMYDRCPGWPTGKCNADSVGNKTKPIKQESSKKRRDPEEFELAPEDEEYCEK